MNIVHGPVNIGNQPWTLSRYENELGFNSIVALNYGTKYSFKADVIISDFASRRFINILRRVMFVFKAIFVFDVFHFYYAKSFATWDDINYKFINSFWDLKLAKKFGKKVIFTLQGCDVRIASESQVNIFTPCRKNGCSAYTDCINSTDLRRLKFIKEILPLADKVYILNPELCRYVPDGIFLPYCNVDIWHTNFKNDENISQKKERDNLIRIVHAPSDRIIKGTDKIISAINMLPKDYKVELILIENMSHEIAIEQYKKADFAIDQLYTGWYGGFSVEVMALHKPVLCYIREDDLKYIPSEMVDDLPVVNVTSENLVEILIDFIRRKNEWEEIGAKSRQFVEKWHDPIRIARKITDSYY